MVTELGRQPWVVRGLLLTADALTPVRPLGPGFVAFTLLYILLGVIVAYLLFRLVRTSSETHADHGANVAHA